METTVLKKIWLSPPHMGGNEETYVKEAFDTNWIAPLGPNVHHFEKSIEDFIGKATYSACLSSGTAAIHLGLELLGLVQKMKSFVRVLHLPLRQTQSHIWAQLQYL